MTDNKLNEALAEKLFGWKRGPASCSDGSKWAWVKPHPSGAEEMVGCICHHTPDFLHDWAAMGLLITAMNGCLHLRQYGVKGNWEAEFCDHKGSIAHAETAPEAVAKAAALALGIVERE